MDFKGLIDNYTMRLDSYMQKIDQLSASNDINNIPHSPNYLEEVIIQICQSLGEYMPKKEKIKIPDPKTYYPIKDYS